MSMKLVEFNGGQAVFVRWQTRKPQAGDHMNIYYGEEKKPGRQVEKRLILKERIHSQPWEVDNNMTEEWWTFVEVSESEFQKAQAHASRNKLIAETHDSLF